MLTQSQLSKKRAKRQTSRKAVRASRLNRKINDTAERAKFNLMPYRFVVPAR
jgi:hypothetical protein